MELVQGRMNGIQLNIINDKEKMAYQSLCKSSKLFLLNSLTVQLLPTFSLNRLSLGTGSRNWSNLDANGREVEYCCVEMTCPSLILETAFLMKVVI